MYDLKSSYGMEPFQCKRSDLKLFQSKHVVLETLSNGNYCYNKRAANHEQ